MRRTGRFLALHDATKFCGYGAELVAAVAETCFDALKTPPRRIAAPEIPVPFSPPEEAFYKPSAGQVIRAVRELVRG